MAICTHPGCEMDLGSPAEQFLHDQLHAEKFVGWPASAFTLCALPYVLFPRIAKLMQDYADSPKPSPENEQERS